MEIARIVAPDGSLLRKDRDEYIAAGYEWCNATYPRACQAVYRTSNRKAGVSVV